MSKIRPIFIVGAPRSGTTMLGSILGSARGCLATPESEFIAKLIEQAEWPGGLLDPGTVRSCLASHPKFRIWGVDADVTSCCIRGPTKLRQLLERLVLAYATRCHRETVDIWVDHTPNSLLILPYLAEVFPDASFLHLVRDGRAVGASILPLDWGPDDIFDAAIGWSCQIALGLAAETSALFEGRIRRVYYESLVSDPSTTIADLCQFCNITFNDRMLEGKGFLVPSYTLNQHSLVGTRPQIANASKWESRLSRRQIEIFEAQAGALLQLLGYPTSLWPSALARTKYEVCASILRKILMRPYNNVRRKRRASKHFRQMIRKPMRDVVANRGLV